MMRPDASSAGGRSGATPKTHRLVATAILAGAALAGCGGSEDPSGPVPPSVILISLDTLRYDHCGFNGYERDTTPFLDQLAEQSIVFDRAYSTMSWTLIAHMSMLTGLYPSQHGVMEAELALSLSFPTLAERLGGIGFTTLGVHFPGWLDGRFGFSRGFDVYEEARSAEVAQEELTEALDRVRPGWPYFLFIHLFDIHSGDLNAVDSTMYQPPAPYDSIWVEDARERLKGIDMHAWWEEPAEPTPEQQEAIIALYDGGIRYVDAKLEAWFTAWEERGLLDNTVIIITADHGEGLRQRVERFGGHGNLFEEGLRIPLLVRLPGGERAGERVDDLVSLVDIVPTVLELVDLEEDPRLPGVSLLGEGRADDDWVFAARSLSRAAISKRQKIFYTGVRPQLLFDLVEDREEEKPLSPKTARGTFMKTASPILDRALARLGEFYEPEPARVIGELDESAQEKLRALGYGGEVGR